MPRPVGTLAEPSDDPKINERRRKAREQARDRAATAKQLKEKGIGAREELDRKQKAMAKAASLVIKEKDKDCEEILAETKKQLKRKEAQIKFLAENINKVDSGAKPVVADTGSPVAYVKVSKARIAELKAKGKAIIAERKAGSVLGAAMKRALVAPKDMTKENEMATKLQTAIRGKLARGALSGAKYRKAVSERYDENERRKRLPKPPRLSSPERRMRDLGYPK